MRNACCPHLHAALLQGTKACLGWDREPQGGSHACTVVVDLWLQLLQLALHLSHNLPKGAADPLARQASLSDAMEPALDIRSQVAQLVKSYQASLQELMTQLLVHWKVKLQPAWLSIAPTHCHLYCEETKLPHMVVRVDGKMQGTCSSDQHNS